MLKKYGALLAAVVLVASLNACLLDPKEPPKPPETPRKVVEPEDLTEKWHVLNNLVASYLLRDITEYQRILDPDYYQFFFSQGDVNNGLPAEGWDITQDVPATTNLLDSGNPNPNRIISIDLDVNMSNLAWIEIAADPTLPDETWWQVNTTYSFTFRTFNDISYITQGSPQVQFVVRNIGTEAEPQWRLVRWFDLGLPE
jgi:hypothetical protein